MSNKKFVSNCDENCELHLEELLSIPCGQYRLVPDIPTKMVINTKSLILHNKEIELDIDITKSISQFEKITINGITFVKESKDE